MRYAIRQLVLTVRPKWWHGSRKWRWEMGLLPRAVLGLEVYHQIRETMNNSQPTLHMTLSFRHTQPPLAPLCALLSADSCVGTALPLPLAPLCVLPDANSCLWIAHPSPFGTTWVGEWVPSSTHRGVKGRGDTVHAHELAPGNTHGVAMGGGRQSLHMNWCHVVHTRVPKAGGRQSTDMNW